MIVKNKSKYRTANMKDSGGFRYQNTILIEFKIEVVQLARFPRE